MPVEQDAGQGGLDIQAGLEGQGGLDGHVGHPRVHSWAKWPPQG